MTFERLKPSSTQLFETVKPKRASQTQAPGQNPVPTPVNSEQTQLSRARFDRDTDLLLRRDSSTQKPGSETTWNNRKFSANLIGTSGDRRIDFTLNRSGKDISGSFAIHGTGRGDIRGHYKPEDKANPLHLVCIFTKVLNPDDSENPNKKPDPELLKLIGQTRVLDGWFLYA